MVKIKLILFSCLLVNFYTCNIFSTDAGSTSSTNTARNSSTVSSTTRITASTQQSSSSTSSITASASTHQAGSSDFSSKLNSLIEKEAKRLGEKTIPQIYQSINNAKGEADYLIGIQFLRKIGTYNVTTNIKNATLQFIKSAQKGNEIALLAIFYMLMAGKEGVIEVLTKDVSWLIKFAINDESVIALDLLYMLSLNPKTPDAIVKELNSPSFQKSFDSIIKRKIRKRDQYAVNLNKRIQAIRSNLKANSEIIEKLKQIFQRGSEGSGAAAYQLACIYFEGNGTEKDLKKAFEYATLAAQKKNCNALYLLSQMYYMGQSVEHNAKKSYELMKEAASLGLSEAQYSLATKYFNGIGVDKSHTDGVYWLTKSADQDNAFALSSLGQLAQSGIDEHGNYSLEPNYEKAFQYYLTSANNGCFAGMYFLAQSE